MSIIDSMESTDGIDSGRSGEGWPALVDELIERARRDREVREELLTNRPGNLVERMQAIDSDNTAWLKSVLERHGWPRRSEVGEDGATAAWLLTQHAAHDRSFQRQCLPLLEEAVQAGEARPSQLAYLTDRLRCADGLPQLYGTQFRQVPHGIGPLQPHPIEDPDNLDERRRSVGLGPFAEYQRRMLEENRP